MNFSKMVETHGTAEYEIFKLNKSGYKIINHNKACMRYLWSFYQNKLDFKMTSLVCHS